MRNPELWDRLEAYTFNAARGSAPYSVKLARAERWSADFTARVIEEYRRFLYLTQVSDRQVTPSQTVDAAWHMHLTFTRDYWDDLCPNVVGAPVHHQPCAGDEEMPRYRDQFAATKALYEAEFGAEPPADIWGGGDQRSPTRGLRALVLSEAGSGMASPRTIAFVPFAISFVLAFVQQTVLSIILALVTGALFVVVVLKPRRRRRGRRSGRGHERQDDWVEGDDWTDGDTGRGSGSGGGRGVGSKRSNESDDGDRKSGSGSGGGGFFAFFTGGGDSDSSDDGGGCGGCGGD